MAPRITAEWYHDPAGEVNTSPLRAPTFCCYVGFEPPDDAMKALRTAVLLSACLACASNRGHAAREDEALPTDVYLETQVDKRVTPRAGNIGPKYPLKLREQNVAGEVHVRFVVDTTGIAIMSTFKVVHSTDDRFESSVREAVSGFRFSPAEIRGRKVKQLVAAPFVFTLVRWR